MKFSLKNDAANDHIFIKNDAAKNDNSMTILTTTTYRVWRNRRLRSHRQPHCRIATDGHCHVSRQDED